MQYCFKIVVNYFVQILKWVLDENGNECITTF